MFQPYFVHIQALMYINQGEHALKIYFVIYEISHTLKMWLMISQITQYIFNAYPPSF
jgi:hypothetical protein